MLDPNSDTVVRVLAIIRTGRSLLIVLLFSEVQDGALDDARVVGGPPAAPVGPVLVLRQSPTRLSTTTPPSRPLVPLARLQLIHRRR